MIYEGLSERRDLVPLGPWLELCEAANVPHVPAEFSQPFPVEQMLLVLDGEPCPELDAAYRWVQETQSDAVKTMARFECCCDGHKKYIATLGQGWTPEWMRPEIDDERPHDCTVGNAPDYTHTRLCVRPWIDALVSNGYPVEFRVFYGPDGFEGVSSYYPQRPLPDTTLIRSMVEMCRHYATRFGLWRSLPVGFTADFIVPSDGLPLFLEGGPPHVLAPVSAHPCAFPPGKISGVALAPLPGALTY